MPEAFLAGAVAGYAIAVPMGPITILIMQLGLHRGLRTALAAAAGAASADGLYATLTGLFGTMLSSVIASIIGPARLLGAVLLAVIAIRGLLDAVRTSRRASHAPDGAGSGAVRTYLVFLGLTVTNPVTFLYFLALTVSLPLLGGAPSARVAFALGAFLASLSWQVVLAIAGAALHGRVPVRAVAATRVIGSVVVLGFAALIGAQALSA